MSTVPYKLLQPTIRCCTLVISGREVTFAGNTYQVPEDMEQTFLSNPRIAKMVADGDLVRAKATGTRRPASASIDPFKPCDETKAEAKAKPKPRKRKRTKKTTDQSPAETVETPAPLEPVGDTETKTYKWFNKPEKFSDDEPLEVERIK